MNAKSVISSELSLSVLMSAYENPGLCPTTRREYARDIAAFIDFLSGRSITPDSIMEYRSALLSAGRSGSSVNRALAAIRSTLKGIGSLGLSARQAAVIGIVLANAQGIKRTPVPVDERRMITPLEFEVILGSSSPHMYFIIQFLYATGVRISEAVGIQLSDCKELGDIVLIHIAGKGNKDREIRITQDLFDDIITEYQGHTYLFETANGRPLCREYVTHQIHRIALRAIGRSTFAHALRHSFASETIKRTGKIGGTSRYLGHSDPATALRYYGREKLTNRDLNLTR